MPPAAPNAGSAIWERFESSPSSTSRLISRPTRKKKTAMRPSLIQRIRGFASLNRPIRISTGVSRKAWYSPSARVFAKMSAATAAITSTIPPADSRRTKSRSAPVTRFPAWSM